jgi:hypothetical protein
VKRRYKNPIILLLALLLSVFAAEVDCVARLCADGTVRSFCYIDAPFSAADLPSQTPTRPARGTLVCPTNHSDTVSDVPYPTCLTGTVGLSVSGFLPVFLAPPLDLPAPLPAEVIARARKTGAPPPLCLPLFPPSPRAPPVA